MSVLRKTTWGAITMSLWNLKPTQTKLNVQKPYLESQTILWEETCPGTKRINQHHMGGKTRTHTKENIVKITGVFETQQYHCRITGFNMFGIKSYLIHNHWTCGSYLIQSSVRNIWPSPTTSWFIDFETPGSHLHLPEWSRKEELFPREPGGLPSTKIKW